MLAALAQHRGPWFWSALQASSPHFSVLVLAALLRQLPALLVTTSASLCPVGPPPLLPDPQLPLPHLSRGGHLLPPCACGLLKARPSSSAAQAAVGLPGGRVWTLRLHPSSPQAGAALTALPAPGAQRPRDPRAASPRASSHPPPPPLRVQGCEALATEIPQHAGCPAADSIRLILSSGARTCMFALSPCTHLGCGLSEGRGLCLLVFPSFISPCGTCHAPGTGLGLPGFIDTNQRCASG